MKHMDFSFEQFCFCFVEVGSTLGEGLELMTLS